MTMAWFFETADTPEEAAYLALRLAAKEWAQDESIWVFVTPADGECHKNGMPKRVHPYKFTRSQPIGELASIVA